MARENGGNNANTSSVKRVLRDSFRTAPPWRIYRDNGRVVFWSYRGHVPAFAIELRSPLPPIASRPLDIHKSNYSAATFSRLGAEIVLFRDLIEGTESRTREGIVIYYLFKALSLSLSHRSNDDDRSQIAVTAIVAFPSSAFSRDNFSARGEKWLIIQGWSNRVTLRRENVGGETLPTQ